MTEERPAWAAVLVVTLRTSLRFNDKVDGSAATAINAPMNGVVLGLAFLACDLIEDLGSMCMRCRRGALLGDRPRHHEMVTVGERRRVGRPHIRA
jgi:hypothetical protein